MNTSENTASDLRIETYPCPDGAPLSDKFMVQVEGQSTGVFANGPHSFAVFSFGGGTVNISVTCDFDVDQVVIRPRSAGIQPEIQGREFSFSLTCPRKLSIEVNDGICLFLFVHALEETPPDREDENVIYYEPGFHDLQRQDIVLRSGQTLYLAGGAYLANGRALVIQDAEDVTVRGRGVLVAHTRVLGACRVRVEGIVINPNIRSWMNKIDVSQDVTYRDLGVLTGDDTVYNYDGFDVMSGCHHIVIDDVFVRATDDILSVKHHPHSPGHWPSRADISDIAFTNAVVWNLRGGSFCRFGPETIGPSIERVTFRNVDVIHNQASSVFEIRTVDGARIQDILFDGLRVEEDHLGFIHFDMADWYKVGDGRGHVKGVYFRNIDVRNGAGESQILGADEGHGFEDIYFHNVRVDGRLVETWSDLGGRLAFAKNLVFGQDVMPPEDRRAPVVEDAAAMVTEADGCATRLYVVFSKPVARDSAEDVRNYTVSAGIHVERAVLHPHFHQVILTTSPMQPGTPYTVSVQNVQDLTGNPVAQETSRPFTVTPSWNASEGFAPFQGKYGWHYEQYNTADVQVYASRKDIVQSPVYWLMNFDAEDGARWVGHRHDAWVTRNAQQPGRDYRSVRTWMAPVGGTVSIEGSVSSPEENGSDVRVRIVRNIGGSNLPDDDREVWAWHTIGAHPVAHRVTAGVNAGDVIRFVADSGGRAGCGAVHWNPSIRYVPGER